VYKRWPKDYEMNVFFTAIYTPGLKELVTKKNNSPVLGEPAPSSSSTLKPEEEVKLKPNWRARLVWTGLKPSEEKIRADEDQAREELQKGHTKKNEDFLADMSGLEYLHGRLERILANSSSGVLLAAADQRILFSVENLTIEGQQLKAEDRIKDFLEVGDPLYCYARPVDVPFTVEGVELTGQAVQVWKGRRLEEAPGESPLSPVKKKASFPPVSDATHLNLVGSVVELATPGVGYLEITAGDMAGERVLFSRNRLYVHGNKLKFRESLADHLTVGARVGFDMVRAAESNKGAEQQGGSVTYHWIAVLAWVGPEPDRNEINEEVFRKLENYRAKVSFFKILRHIYK
jgi:hypothetical protein